MSKLASVLIVDDNPRCLEFMTLAFSAHGGVDVKGDALRLVIIEKLPFASPDDALTKARI